MDLVCSKEIILENERTLLRPLQASDLRLLLPVASSDDKLVQFSPKPIHTEELLREYINVALYARRAEQRYPFIIFDKQANAWAGSTSFHTFSNFDKRVEIGATWIGRQFQKTGLNRACKHLMLDYAFNTLDFERVEFRTDERNTASRTAIEKIGGKFEGIMRSHTLMSDGFRRNTAVYSILKNEWKGL